MPATVCSPGLSLISGSGKEGEREETNREYQWRAPAVPRCIYYHRSTFFRLRLTPGSRIASLTSFGSFILHPSQISRGGSRRKRSRFRFQPRPSVDKSGRLIEQRNIRETKYEPSLLPRRLPAAYLSQYLSETSGDRPRCVNLLFNFSSH